MPGAVLVKALAGQGRALDHCRAEVLRQDVADTKPREPLPSLVAEERRIRATVQLRFHDELLQHLCHLRPERADSPLSSLTEQGYLGWRIDLQVTGVQVDDFLDPCAGIKQHPE